MNSFFDKLQMFRSVLKRTRPRADLPSLVLYVEAASGQAKRKVLDTDGKEHSIQEALLQSQYKLVTGAQAKTLIGKHWPDIKKKAEESSGDSPT